MYKMCEDCVLILPLPSSDSKTEAGIIVPGKVRAGHQPTHAMRDDPEALKAVPHVQGLQPLMEFLRDDLEANGGRIVEEPRLESLAVEAVDEAGPIPGMAGGAMHEENGNLVLIEGFEEVDSRPDVEEEVCRLPEP